MDDETRKAMAMFTNPAVMEQQIYLMSRVGNAISAWAQMEMMLIIIFRHCTDLDGEMTAAIIENVTGFSMLLKLCNSTVRTKLKDRPELVHWKSLHDYANDISGDRNSIAHQSVVTTTSDDGVPVCTLGPNTGVMLGGPEKAPPMDVHEVNEVTADINELINYLGAFSVALYNGTTSDERFQKPAPRRRPSRQKRLQIWREAQKHQQSPSQK